MEAPLKHEWPNPNFPYQLPSFNLNKDPSKDDPCFLKKIDSIRQQFAELGIPSLSEDFLGTLTLLPGQLQNGAYRIKTCTAENHTPVTHSSTLVLLEDRVEVYIHTNQLIAQDRHAKIKEAVRIIFSKDDALPRVFREIKYSSNLNSASAKSDLQNRVYKSRILNDCPYIVPLDYWSSFNKTKKDKTKQDKLNLFYPRFESDLMKMVKTFPEGNIPFKSFLTVVSDIMQGIHAMHQKRLLHKDIKFENIVVNWSKEEGDQCIVKKAALIDLEFCSCIDDMAKLAASLGSFCYLSPERILLYRDDGNYPFTKLKSLLGISSQDDVINCLGFSSDLWALGCILYFFKHLRSPSFLILLSKIELTENKIVKLYSKIKKKQKKMNLDNFKDHLSSIERLKKEIAKREKKNVERFKEYEDILISMDSNFVQPNLKEDLFGGLTSLLLRIKPSDRMDSGTLLKILEPYRD